MRRYISKNFILNSTIILLIGSFACNKQFLNNAPLGSASLSTLGTADGVNAVLIGAYKMLSGESDATSYTFGAGAEEWVYGDVTAGNSYKGSDPGDQPDILSIETFTENAANPYFNDKWKAIYEGVSRTNQTLIALTNAKAITAAQATEITAEARFLRGYFHFDAVKLFKNVPYIDETATNFKVPNNANIYTKIEADLQFAASNLPVKQTDVGRPTKYAAQALLAKVYLFEQNYKSALPLLDSVINNGHYSLTPNYYNNFNAADRNNSEEIFQVQYSVNDGAVGTTANGNYGDVLNFPYGSGPVGCCSFNQPSQNFVNAFKTDANGLPFLDGSYNSTDLLSDQGIASSAAFTPDNKTNLDPRLDWSVGRRGVPYLDWGVDPGSDWIRNQASAGPYTPKKNVYQKSQQGSYSQTSGWTTAPNAINYSIVRYDDVLLWAAECEVEVGSVATAIGYVNQIRGRAAKSIVWKTAADGSDFTSTLSPGYVGTPAANYVVGQYPTTLTQDDARKAVRFERRLEMGMEGHYFFDLVRWGEAASFINNYLTVESKKRPFLVGATFTAGINEYFPIPQSQIDLSSVNGVATLTQNHGY